MLKRLRRFAALLLLPFASVAAAAPPPLVLAAASLQESMNAAADAWAAQGHARPVVSFAGSSAPASICRASAEEPANDTTGRARVPTCSFPPTRIG